jgi:hypothetical protein
VLSSWHRGPWQADGVASDTDTLVSHWLTLPEVADALGVSVSRVRQMLTEHHLVAVRRGDSNALMVPGDLVADGKVLKGLPGVLTLLSDARYSEDEAVRWLYTDDDLPGSPVEALAANRGTEVKRRAQALGF